MKSANDVIDADMDYICGNLKEEFRQMQGPVTNSHRTAPENLLLKETD